MATLAVALLSLESPVEIVAETVLAISGVGVAIIVARIALNKVFQVVGIDRAHSSEAPDTQS